MPAVPWPGAPSSRSSSSASPSAERRPPRQPGLRPQAAIIGGWARSRRPGRRRRRGAGRSPRRWRSRRRPARARTSGQVAASRAAHAGSTSGKAASARDVDEPGRAQAPRQRPPEGEIGAPRRQQGPEPGADPVGQSSSSGPGGSRQLSGCRAGSASSTSSQPPGPQRADHRRQRRARERRRGRAPAGRGRGRRLSGGAVRPDVVTSHLDDVARRGRAPDDTSMSVASTRPPGPTRSASHRTTDVPPAPTSQQRQPGADAEVRRGGGRSTGRTTSANARKRSRGRRRPGCRAGTVGHRTASAWHRPGSSRPAERLSGGRSRAATGPPQSTVDAPPRRPGTVRTGPSSCARRRWRS